MGYLDSRASQGWKWAVRGHPSGKSQKVAAARRPGDVLFDTTALWRAFKDPEQTERSEEDARIAMANDAPRA